MGANANVTLLVMRLKRVTAGGTAGPTFQNGKGLEQLAGSIGPEVLAQLIFIR